MIVRGFSKGKAHYSAKSGKLNVPSDRKDKRLKENARYRSGRVKKGQLVKEEGKTFILFADGMKVRTEVSW
jgi:ribosomal protein S4E